MMSTITPSHECLVHSELNIVVVQSETQTLSMRLVLYQFISLKAQLTEEIFTLLSVLRQVVQSLACKYSSL